MEDQYGLADLRQYITSRPNLFPPPPQPPDLLSGDRGLHQPHPYDMLVFRPDSTNSAAPGVNIAVNNIAGASGSGGGGCGSGFLGFESGLSSGGGGDGGAGRWPRQETLTLLEIRSRLDPKFKEANQKSPLWDEVSRIMSEEHGYQRSGKKCREKFENLYKYYKKTKEGKAGRQDGKHYRFFRQLEALYGENNSNNNIINNSSASLSEAHNHHHHIGGPSFNHYNFSNKEPFIQGTPKFSDNTSLSLSNYSEADTSSSDNNDTDLNEQGTNETKRSGKTGWKLKIKDFVDLQMKKMMEKQEAWMEKMMTTIEHKERERMMREEEWRKQDEARIEREHKFWAGERAWIEARDVALMEALRKLTGKEIMDLRSLSEYRNYNSDDKGGEIWPENEISRLVELQQQSRGGVGSTESLFWEEIGNKMSCLGHERSSSGMMCKDKWESVNNYLLKCNKKRRENTKSCSYYNHVSNQGGDGVYCHNINNNSEHGVEPNVRLSDQNNSSLSPNNSNNNNGISESCFRYYMGEGYGRIME